MIYELPAGAKTASDIDWTGAVTGVKESPFYRSWYRKNPINEKGDLKSMGKGEGNMVLSYYCRQFTSGKRDSHGRWAPDGRQVAFLSARDKPKSQLYLIAAGVSWALTGDFGARNIFERLAGLADGGYTDKPMRPGLQRIQAGLGLGRIQAGLGLQRIQAGLGRISGSGRPAACPGRRLRGPASAARA